MDRRRGEQQAMTAAQQRLREGGDRNVPVAYLDAANRGIGDDQTGEHVGRHRLQDRTQEIPVQGDDSGEKRSNRGLAVTAAISLPAGAALLATGIVQILGER